MKYIKYIKQINPKFVWILSGALVFVLILFLIPGSFVSISNDSEVSDAQNLSPITNLPCTNKLDRPIAVMMAGDAEARPLSGLSRADLVVEMAVDPRPITRFMSVFQCDPPDEIGSIRSAREDFIPLALGFDAIFAHWGGERNALNQLNEGISDNVDALKYDGIYFTRKNGTKPPHNGFTSPELIKKASDKFGYKNVGGFSLKHSDSEPARSLSNIADSISIDYLFPVKWVYDQSSGLYKRYRGGTPEIDKIDGTQVAVSNVVVIETEARWIGDQYISVKTQGEGTATFYARGVSTPGRWRKDPSNINSQLEFLNSNGKPFEFYPGRIWIQIKSPIQ